MPSRGRHRSDKENKKPDPIVIQELPKEKPNVEPNIERNDAHELR